MILILAHPYTGSSLVTKIFHAHGAWIGETDQEKRFNYQNYENFKLREVIKKIKGGKLPGKILNPESEQLEAIEKAILDIKPQGLLCFKVLVDYYKLFLQFNPKIILVRRNEDQTIKSAIAKNNRTTKEEIEKAYYKRLMTMGFIELNYGGKWVDVDQLIAGNYTLIKEAIEYCGLAFDEQVTESCIDKNKWNTR